MKTKIKCIVCDGELIEQDREYYCVFPDCPLYKLMVSANNIKNTLKLVRRVYVSIKEIRLWVIKYWREND